MGSEMCIRDRVGWARRWGSIGKHRPRMWKRKSTETRRSAIRYDADVLADQDSLRIPPSREATRLEKHCSCKPEYTSRHRSNMPSCMTSHRRGSTSAEPRKSPEIAQQKRSPCAVAGPCSVTNHPIQFHVARVKSINNHFFVR